MNKDVTTKNLKEWISEHDLLFKITEEQAGAIIDTLKKAACSVELRKDAIYWSLDGGEFKSVMLDDLVDYVAEKNYELTEKVKSDLEEVRNDMKCFVSKLKDFINLQANSELIDKAFEQTIYAKKISEAIAEPLKAISKGSMRR